METIIVASFGGQGCNIRRCCRPEGTQDVWKDYRFYGNPSKYQYWRYLVISIKEPNPRFVIDLVWCNSKRILIFENDVEYYEYWQQESDSHHSSSCFWKTDINPFWNNTMGYFAKLLQNDTFLSIRLPRILDSICQLEDKMDGHRNAGNVFSKRCHWSHFLGNV